MHEHRDEELARALSGLPVPPRSDDFFPCLQVRIARPGLRRLPRRRLVATAAAVGLALVGAGFAGAELAGPSRGATPPPVTSFQPALGWNTFETNVLADPTQPEVLWAANVPFKAEALETPVNTIKSLPGRDRDQRRGPWSYTGRDPVPDLSLPATLSEFYFHGKATPPRPVCTECLRVLLQRPHRRTEILEFEVWMRSNDPTPAMKAAPTRSSRP